MESIIYALESSRYDRNLHALLSSPSSMIEKIKKTVVSPS